jgi:hypothetical protein
MRRTLLVSASLVLAMAIPTTSAQAKPTDQFRFADHDSYVLGDFCGDIPVRVEFSERGSGVGRFAGRGRQLRYTVTHHGAATYTNLDTGRAFTFAWNYIDQDKRVTDNGDGTLSILGNSPGSERVKGPDGKLLDVKAGLFRWVVVLEDEGTPTDPSDDTFVSITFLSGPDVYTELCDDFRALTS